MNLKIQNDYTAAEYKQFYNTFLSDSIKSLIDCDDINDVYYERLIDFYKNCNRNIRMFLRSFVLSRLRDYLSDNLDDKNLNEQLIFKRLLDTMLSIKQLV